MKVVRNGNLIFFLFPIHFCRITLAFDTAPIRRKFLAAATAACGGSIFGYRSALDMSNASHESSATTREASELPSSEKTVHYLFLVHGWMGNDAEMAYLETALHSAILDGASDSSSRVAVHRTRCNNGKTHDGIRAGGERLANEMQELIQSDVTKEDSATISMVGNSLGGLYARYALARLPSRITLAPSSGEDTDKTEERTVPIYKNVFCTTCTPHLGVASHTYLPLSRFLERMIASLLQRTGSDLFRTDSTSDEDLIYRMATEGTYWKPLAEFQHRVAYANAFCTDFQVSTNTAAFLSPNSNVTHHIDVSDSVSTTKHVERHNEANNEEDHRFVALVVRTNQNLDYLNIEDDDTVEEHEKEEDLLVMSKKLDALGWTKVFMDVRDEIPILSIPKFWGRKSRNVLSDFIRHRIDDDTSIGDDNVPILSRELVPLMNHSDRFVVPLGHTVMVANSKNDFYARLNSRGRPVMDALANDLIRDILQYGIRY